MAHQVRHVHPEFLGVQALRRGFTGNIQSVISTQIDKGARKGPSLDMLEVRSPAQQLWVGEDLLESAVVADAKREDGLSRVAGKMSGYPCWEGQHHLSRDFHNTPGTPGGTESKEKSHKSRNIVVVKLH